MRHSLAPVLLVLASACGPAHSIQVVEPRAAPLFARLLGEPLPGVPGDTAWARRAGDADRALAEGRPGESRALLAAALEALPADAPPCSLRGGLLYLRGLAARLAGAEDAAWRELEAACLDAVVPSGEEAARRRLAAQVRRLPAGSAGADSGPRHLWTWMEAPAAAPPEELVALREDAAALGGDDGAALALVAEWMEISRRRTDDVCDRGFEARRGEELRRIRAALEGLGRPELALAGRIRELVEDRRLVPGALAALAAWVDEPQHRWLRTA
ncbi:MAG: hypothetical protein FJ098_07630, partial [Deltaproteobacteria bacterium]|nr:hypothetical protein [Deltaproteobacteria bacterium]